MPSNSKNLFKKKGKYVQEEGGLGQNPLKKINKEKSSRLHGPKETCS